MRTATERWEEGAASEMEMGQLRVNGTMVVEEMVVVSLEVLWW